MLSVELSDAASSAGSAVGGLPPPRLLLALYGWLLVPAPPDDDAAPADDDAPYVVGIVGGSLGGLIFSMAPLNCFDHIASRFLKSIGMRSRGRAMTSSMKAICVRTAPAKAWLRMRSLWSALGKKRNCKSQ